MRSSGQCPLPNIAVRSRKIFNRIPRFLSLLRYVERRNTECLTNPCRTQTLYCTTVFPVRKTKEGSALFALPSVGTYSFIRESS